MRAVELAKVAAAAEALRLRRIVHRQGMRAAYAAVAAVFGIAVFVLLHVVVFYILTGPLSPLWASVILLAFDLVVAGILAILALRNSPDSIEREAMAVRRQAVGEMKRAMTVVAVASEATGYMFRRRVRSAAREGVGGRAWLLGQLASRVLARR